MLAEMLKRKQIQCKAYLGREEVSMRRQRYYRKATPRWLECAVGRAVVAGGYGAA